jgi:hypothetical protein
MKLRMPNGKLINGSIFKDKHFTISVMGEGDAPMKMEDLEDCEVIEATSQERNLLKEGCFKIKGI